MKGLVSLAVVVAFLVAIPQCLGQDAEQSPAQLLTEQQLVQMLNLLMVQRPENTILICHIPFGPPQDPDEGFTLMLRADSPSLKGHCKHGDCTNFALTGVSNNCTCGGDDGTLTELCDAF